MGEKVFQDIFKEKIGNILWVKNVKKNPTLPTVPWVFDYGFNWDRITVGKKPAGLLRRG